VGCARRCLSADPHHPGLLQFLFQALLAAALVWCQGAKLPSLSVFAYTTQVRAPPRAMTALRARWATLRARWVTLRARWVTLRARWVTLRARWVALRARWVTLRSSLGDAKSSLGDAKSSLSDTLHGAIDHPSHRATAEAREGRPCTLGVIKNHPQSGTGRVLGPVQAV
jgi:hypothetical protein